MGRRALAVGVGEPGKEIQQPMVVVILGDIFTSIFLNMIVIPALYLKHGRPEPLRWLANTSKPGVRTRERLVGYSGEEVLRFLSRSGINR